MIPAPARLHPAVGLRLALAGGVALALGLALAPGAWIRSSLRGVAAACAIGGAALLARTGAAAGAPGRRLVVVARQALSREVGVALLELDGRPVLIGYGAGGVQVLEPAAGAPGPLPPAGDRP